MRGRRVEHLARPWPSVVVEWVSRRGSTGGCVVVHPGQVEAFDKEKCLDEDLSPCPGNTASAVDWVALYGKPILEKA